MRKLTMGLMLMIAFSVHAASSDVFSINENDTKENYANNPMFTKVEPDTDMSEKHDIYKFIGTPESLYFNLKTSDLDILGGYIIIDKSTTSNRKRISLKIKGKANFDKLLNRLNQGDYLNDMTCNNVGMEKGHHLFCLNPTTQKQIILGYDPFTDSALLYILPSLYLK